MLLPKKENLRRKFKSQNIRDTKTTTIKKATGDRKKNKKEDNLLAKVPSHFSLQQNGQ